MLKHIFKRKSKTWNVWSEGYACTGESAKAQFLGEFEAPTFKQAIIRAMKEKEWDMSQFDEENLTYWGCSFYPTEKQARKYFG